MRFINGPIPESRTFDPVTAGWTPLRTPDARRFVVVALLCTVPFLLAATGFFLDEGPAWRALFRRQPWSLPGFLMLLAALVPVHELIHALAYGCGLRSPNLVVGFWRQRGIPYVLCDEPLPRRRVLWMLAAPFCGLTLLPLLAVPWLSGAWLSGVLFFSLLHAALCVGDAAACLRLLRQAPADARIHNQGWQTYWAVPKDVNAN
ncbi:DUF3267 domain-containing protein [Prosthecobacter sp.]|uniref:DUF3267 domain-containing protein n=1 Tax=Prosthecobacter sp. TaxID=1965333 RepID=UPI002AB971D9|nr:DUF3267 domain-containing protein [Prosthecobacter sp.]MDZ4405374.1 DUF3267 domain-containing protein [Prosthecobacter sp.]